MLHAWWPGGLIAGGVGGLIITQVMGLGVGASLGAISLGWKVKMALILIPTLLAEKSWKKSQRQRKPVRVSGR
jgi:hypothetical protein